MVRGLVGMLGVAVLAACASTPKTPSEMILGKWSCEAAAEGMSISGAFEYLPGGLMKATPKISIDTPGMAIAMTGSMDATWEFLADGQLKEVIKSLKAETASMSGQALAPAMISSMIQPMIDQMIVNQEALSTPTFTATSFTSTDTDGMVTTCKR